jgi:hypothetical protein
MLVWLCKEHDTTAKLAQRLIGLDVRKRVVDTVVTKTKHCVNRVMASDLHDATLRPRSFAHLAAAHEFP